MSVCMPAWLSVCLYVCMYVRDVDEVDRHDADDVCDVDSTVCQNVFSLVGLINHNSVRATSCLVFKTVTYLNSLKLCILAFMFETVAKTCRKC